MRKSVRGVKVTAALQTPLTTGEGTAGVGLELEGVGGDEDDDDDDDDDEEEEDDGDEDDRDEDEDENDDGRVLGEGATVQRTVRYELKEEGLHVLVVTVSYTEMTTTTMTAAAAEVEAKTVERARTFRKLYQFTAQQLLAVRSKVTERKSGVVGDGARQWVVEAQLENVGEASVVLERVWLKEAEGIMSRAVNRHFRREGDGDGEGGDAAIPTVLKAQDVEQVMFWTWEKKSTGEEEEEGKDSSPAGAKAVMGQINIDWRSAMGEQGRLTTGWLVSRGR
jgi:hypothetical protein